MNWVKITLLQAINVSAFIIMVFVNILADILPFGGFTTREISDSIPNLLVPAGFTFSIWGVIYTFLFFFVFYQAWDFPRKDKNDFIHKKISLYFIISCIANSLWVLCWHYLQIYLSLGCILILLVSLIQIYRRLEIGKVVYPLKQKLALTIPFRIYLAWICIATISNFTAALNQFQWQGFGLSQYFWTVGLIVLSSILTAHIVFKNKDVVFGIVVIWGLFGIILKRFSSYSDYNEGLIIWTLISLLFIAYAISFEFTKKVKKVYYFVLEKYK